MKKFIGLEAIDGSSKELKLGANRTVYDDGSLGEEGIYSQENGSWGEFEYC